MSKDGTVIGYRQIGSGKGLIICHGGGRISQNYQKLALELAGNYTVYIPDRRGQGLSGKAGTDYDINKASEDLIAMIKTTGADLIFGHSAGGLIALETMLSHPIKKLAVYEPSVSVNGSLPSDWLTDFETAMQDKQFKKAMAISLKGLQVHEGINKMSMGSLLVLINVLTLIEKKKEHGTRMLDLLDTLPADMNMVVELDSKYQRYSDFSVPTFLMTGSKSPAYFHMGIQALEDTLSQSKTKTFEGFDHYSPEGKVKEIAKELNYFFDSAN